MAKISARGDKAEQTWDIPNGGKVVLTKRGRILRKYYKGGSYTLLQKSVSLEVAEHYVRATKASYSL